MSHALIKVKCTRCQTVFLRYNYGYGRKRQYKPHHKTKKEAGMDRHGHPKLLDTCILCRGIVEQIK